MLKQGGHFRLKGVKYIIELDKSANTKIRWK